MYTNQYRDVFTTFSFGFHTARAAAVLPDTAAESIFTVATGRVLVTLLIGEITTVNDGTGTNLKVTLTPTTGTAGDVASDLAVASLEEGGIYLVEGDGSALVGVSAGGSYFAAGAPSPFVVAVGTIDIETSATQTGAAKWDIWYLPLDAGATITAA